MVGHNIFVVFTFELVMLTIISLFLFSRSGRKMFPREIDLQIEELRQITDCQLWRFPEKLCKVIDERGFYPSLRAGTIFIPSWRIARTYSLGPHTGRIEL